MSLVFGGRVFHTKEPSEDDAARSALATKGPAELEAAAAAAAAEEAQRVLLEKLWARREALRSQMSELQDVAGPAGRTLFSSSATPPPAADGQPSTQSTEPPSKNTVGAGPRGRSNASGATVQGTSAKRPRRTQQPTGPAARRSASGGAGSLTTAAGHTSSSVQQGRKAQNGRAPSTGPLTQVPILTTSGELPFEVGLQSYSFAHATPAFPGSSEGKDSSINSRPGYSNAYGGPGGSSSNSNSGGQRIMPVFSLPAVGAEAKFVRRIPREDTAAEKAAREAEAAELLAMKEALGVTDTDLWDLEQETLAMLRGGGGSGGGDEGEGNEWENDEEDENGNMIDASLRRDAHSSSSRRRRRGGKESLDGEDLDDGITAKATSLRLPRVHSSTLEALRMRGGAQAPEGRSTPRALQRAMRGNANAGARGAGTAMHELSKPQALKEDLTATLSAYEGFADAVRRDLQQLSQSGVPITNKRAARHMKMWGCEKFYAILSRTLNSLLGASLERWRLWLRQLRAAERREAYRKYQAVHKLDAWITSYRLKFIAVAWVRWLKLMEWQRDQEWQQRRHWAARLVQNSWRGRQARDAVQALRLVLERERRDRAATRMQRWFNACRTRWAYHAMVRARKERVAAILIQTRIRILLAKRRARELRSKHLRIRAAIAIQCAYRRMVASALVRSLLQELIENEAGVEIQRVARGMMARLMLARMKRRKIEDRAAIALQRRARGWLARSRVDRMRAELAKERARLANAAVLVQKVYRGHVDRLKTQSLLAALRQRKLLEANMAIRLQAGGRGMMARKRVRELRESRDESLLENARAWAESSPPEGGGASCYVHAETGETVWEAPAGGYTRLDGKLVLATGRVIDDPFLSMTEDEQRAKKLEKKCSECEERDATRQCDQCGDKFCASCYDDTHVQGARAKHTWYRLGHVECAECANVPKPAIRWCIVCDDPFCAVHWDDLHRSGKRATHPFCLIDPETGAVDVNATSVVGDSTGRFGHIAPPLRGGGDDGQGGLLEPEQEEGGAEADYVGEGGEGLAAGGGGALQGGWEQFEDEGGAPYWYNAESGESTYDNPNAAGGAEGGAAAGGEGEASDWQEAWDEEGNMYYHNVTTGESTYDSPHG